MKFKYLSLVVIVVCILFAGNAMASCFENGCHGESSDTPCPHAYDHDMVEESQCKDCHFSEDYPDCEYLEDVSHSPSSSSAGVNIGNIYDKDAIMESAKDTIDEVNTEGDGIITKILGICAAVWILTMIGVVLLGGAKYAAGKETGDDKKKNSGLTMIVGALVAGLGVPVALILLGIFTGAL